MNRANQFFDKFLKSFDKVSDNEKKEYLKGYPIYVILKILL